MAAPSRGRLGYMAAPSRGRLGYKIMAAITDNTIDDSGGGVGGAGGEAWAVPAVVRRAWRPLERLSVSRWADCYRYLQQSYSAEPGRWHTRRVPYLGEVMDVFADPAVGEITLVKSARVGGTEAGNNCIAYGIDQEPGPMLYVYPTEQDVKEEFRDRLVKLIEGSPRLASRIPHAGWDSRTELQLATCNIYSGWPKAQRTLIRRTCRYVFFDELDNCDQQSGLLGNTYKLGRKRLITFGERAKAMSVTTPSTPDGSSWQLWEHSDQRRYHVPCPLCGAYQVLAFDRIRVPAGQRDADKIEADDLAWYECQACRGQLKYRRHQRWMVLRGVWIARGRKIVENLPVGDKDVTARAVFEHPRRWLPEITGAKPRTRRAGFHIWAAYSPWVSWSQIISEWFRCKDDRDARIVFYNQVLGLPWEEVVHAASAKLLRERVATGLPRGEVPEGAVALTAGVDVQENRIYYVVRAWGAFCESWLIDHGCIWVASEQENILHALQAFYMRVVLDRPYGEGEGRAPDLTLIDSGYRTRDVYGFCQVHPHTLACKGEESALNHLVRQGKVEPKRRRKAEQHAAGKLWLVNATQCKDTIYSWAAKIGDGMNAMRLHAEVDDDYVHQFTAEHKVWDPRKKREVWKPKTEGRANHYLDCEVYALAAAELVHALSIRGSKRRTGRGGGRRGGRSTGKTAAEFLGLER